MTDGTWTYTWLNGRELASMTDGTTTWNYTYDANGMRTSRTNGTKTYNYVYNGSRLTQMTVGSDTLYFTYGLLGPTTVTWNGTTYYYALNIQGDVVGIYDEAGNPVVTYNWDNAWGYNPIPEGVMASTLGELNPLRYRGYVYDQETEYYYLQSRYYDPEIGRFINVDAFASTGQGLLGNNMFAYCLNNPVCRKDVWGTFSVAILDSNGNNIPDEKEYAGHGGSSGNGVYDGNGSNSGKLTFKSETALNEHYEQHNSEFGNAFSSPQEYVDAANYVIQNGQYVANQNAYVKFYGMNGHANYAFVGMSRDLSYITTFHLKDVKQIQF